MVTCSASMSFNCNNYVFFVQFVLIYEQDLVSSGRIVKHIDVIVNCILFEEIQQFCGISHGC